METPSASRGRRSHLPLAVVETTIEDSKAWSRSSPCIPTPLAECIGSVRTEERPAKHWNRGLTSSASRLKDCFWLDGAPRWADCRHEAARPVGSGCLASEATVAPQTIQAGRGGQWPGLHRGPPADFPGGHHYVKSR